MKIVFISHSYLNPEYQKNISALSAFRDYEFKNVPNLNRSHLKKTEVELLSNQVSPYRGN